MSKNNRLLIILLLLLVALFFVIRQTRDHRERRTRLLNISLDAVSSIEMKTARDTLVITRHDFDWEIEHPFLINVDHARLDSFFKQVLPVEKSNIPVALSEESFANYRVTDQSGTLVSFYDRNDNLLDSVIIGRSGRFAYARRPDDNEVYQLTDNIGFIVNPNVTPWRSKQIVSIPRGQIESIDVTYELNQYTIAATDTLWLFTDAEQSFSVKDTNSSLRQILAKIERMNTYSFKDFQYEEYMELLRNPQLELNIIKTDGSQTSLIFAYLSTEEGFIAQKNDVIDHLYIIDTETVNLFTKSPQHFQ